LGSGGRFVKPAVLGYVSRQKKNLIAVSNLAEPLSTAEFAKAAGFLRKRAGRTELLVPAAARFSASSPIMSPWCGSYAARASPGLRAASSRS
jgi:hypothetical protein